MVLKYKSSCPLNCWDNCGFEISVNNGMVSKIEGDLEHPITKGKICGRGRLLEARTNSSERILYPLKKVNGKFEKISWEQALVEISAKMIGIKETVGTTAVLHSHDYANNGLLKSLDYRFFNCYGGVTELTGSLCWGAGIEAQMCDFGNSYSHSPDDIKNSNHIVIWGRNIARTNIHLFSKLKEMKQLGKKVIVIDPLYNATAKIADHYLSVKPGMDSFLALGVMKEMLRLNLEDQIFITECSIGFEGVQSLLDKLTFEQICKYAEVSYEDIKLLAQVYSSRPVSTYIGLGIQRYQNGGNTIRAIDALIAMSGNVGIPGGGANFGNLAIGQSFDISALTLPHRKKDSRTFTRMKQFEQILQVKNPEIKMIFVSRSNPLTQVPNTSVVKEAFATVETKVVIDQFLTDTAELADYVLPCTTVFEEEDIYYSSMYHHYVNYGPKLVAAPGEAKSDLWIWTNLAEKLGFGEDFNYSTEQFIEMGLGDLKEKGITLSKLKSQHHLALPVAAVPWKNKSFQTPSGKYEFHSQRAVQKGLNGNLQLLFPKESVVSNYELAKSFPYTLLSIHPQRSNHSQHYLVVEQIQSVKVEVSIDIAADHQLQEGDTVRVFNNRGEVFGAVRLMKQAHPKTINIDEGQWKRFGETANILTPHDESDNGLGSTIYDCLVNIEKVRA